MSDPVNPLDKFRSHSIHYILTIAQTTEALRPFADGAANGQVSYLNALAGKKLGEEITPGVYLLIDTRKTAEFNLTNVSFETVVNDKSSKASSSTFLSSVHLTIEDPSGIGFFNYLKYLIDEKFKCSVSSMFMNLNIIFVGHTDTGTSEIVATNGIILIPTGEFTLSNVSSKGAIYNMELSANGNIGQQHYSLTKLPNTFNFTIKESLLGNAIQSLENKLNLVYKNYHESLQVEITEQTSETEATAKKIGKLVQFMFTIPKDWFYYTIPTQAEKNKETAFRGVPPEHGSGDDGKLPNSQFSTSQDGTINEVLNHLFTLCPEIMQKFNSEKAKSGDGKIYKILTSITSDDDIQLIHYDVIEYSVPNINRDISKIKDNGKVDPKGLGIEFEYIFSGKNIDILDFNFEILNLYAGLIPTVNGNVVAKKEQLEKTQQKPDNDSKPADKKQTGYIPEKEPAYVPPQTNIQKNNLADITTRNHPGLETVFTDSQEFHKALADLMFASHTATLKIRGNPLLFSNCSISSVAPHVKLSSSVQEYTSNITGDKIEAATQWEYNYASKSPISGSSTIIQAHIEHRKYIDGITDSSTDSASLFATGQYAKVHIYGPKDYPFSGDMGLNDYKVKLFYDGWYFVNSIKTTFNGSDFTQELELITLEPYGNYASTTSATNSKVTN